MKRSLIHPLLLMALFPGPVNGQQDTAMPDLLTGNLSVRYLMWMAGSTEGERPLPEPPDYFQRLREAGVDGVEDYICFLALEPEKGHPDWSFYRTNCRRARAAGLRYGVYPWLHFTPEWFTRSSSYTPYVCLEHGEATYSTSIWAPGTLEMYDRFYRMLREEFGDNLIVRSTHGGLPAFFYKRFSTPALFYGASLLTEPPSNVERDEEVRRIFNDATNASSRYFDYPGNIFRSLDIYEAYLPAKLFREASALRDICDYGLVDENLVRDGALEDFQLLVILEGRWFEQETLDSLDAWVRRGGTLLLYNRDPMLNIEGEGNTFREPADGDSLQVRGKGKVLYLPGETVSRDEFRKTFLELVYGVEPAAAPPLDLEFDSIHTAVMKSQ